MIYIYLTPQLHDTCYITGKEISKFIYGSMDKDSATYQIAALDTNIIFASQDDVSIIFSNGEVCTVREFDKANECKNDLHSLIEKVLQAEFAASKEIESIDMSKLTSQPIKQQIVTSALCYYQGKEFDANKEEITNDAIDEITKIRKNQNQIRTELDLVMKIRENDNIDSAILSVVYNGKDLTTDSEIEGFVKLLNSIVRTGNPIPMKEVSITDILKLEYTISFWDTDIKIQRALNEDGEYEYYTLEK